VSAGSRRLKAVVVDDEPPARALLREYLGAHADVEVAAECANGFEAVKRIGDLAPDLVFLDVQMPKLDGFEVLELLDPGPLVIFVTAYDEHALRAFEVNAVDYLLKPFSRERLAEALGRARERAGRRGMADTAGSQEQRPAAAAPAQAATAAQAARLAAAARPAGRHAERIVVKEGAQVHVIPVERLDLLEAQDDYVSVRSGGRSWLKAQPLGDLAAGLDPARFVRIHRSYVVNVERIAKLELYAKDSRVAILKDGTQLPVSRSGYARLREMM
jgi:two-component system LytT family response regulator